MALPGALRRWPRAAVLALGIAGAAVLVASVEAHLRRRYPLPVERTFECRAVRPGLGGGFRANCTARWVRHIGDQVVFDVGFSTDAFGRRRTPQEGTARRHLALFMGCSFTLGAGVEDEETFPSRFAALASDHRILNYGASGFGPQHTLARLDQGLAPDELGPFEGTPLLVYTMIPDHIARAAGARSVIGTFGRHFPAYSLSAAGGLVREGTFAEARPWRTALARWMMGSALLRRLPELVGRRDTDVELTARIVVEASRRFRVRFRSDRFAVAAYPGAWPPAERRLFDRLREAGIAVLTSNDVPAKRRTEMRLRDGHPTALAHGLAASWLHAELTRRGWLELDGRAPR